MRPLQIVHAARPSKTKLADGTVRDIQPQTVSVGAVWGLRDCQVPFSRVLFAKVRFGLLSIPSILGPFDAGLMFSGRSRLKRAEIVRKPASVVAM